MKRITGALLALMLLISLCAPQTAQTVSASSKVRVNYKGKTVSYEKRRNFLFINGKRKSLGSTPIFLKSGTNCGPLAKIFLSSPLNVKCKSYGDKLVLKYKKRTLIIKNGSINTIENGKRKFSQLGASPMRAAKYKGVAGRRWIVPIRSICLRLGIKYQTKGGVIYLGTDTSKTANSAAATATKVPSVPVTNSAASTALPTVTSRSPVVLVLDAGHGGIDSGALSPKDEGGFRLAEKNLNLAIVLAAKAWFDKDPRFKVLYTRTGNTYPSLDARCQLANNNNADLFISVHINSFGASSTGTETLYNASRLTETSKNGINSRELALAMQAAALEGTEFPNRGLVNRIGLRVLNRTNMPACLIEYGFISNKREANQMNGNTTKYGRKLYEGVVKFMKAKGRIS